MPQDKGSAVAGVEIDGMALGETKLAGAALGPVVLFEQHAKILAVLSSPTAPVKVNADFNITLSINRQTKTITFFRENGVGLGKSNISQTDMPDGTREYSCMLKLGTQGNQTIYICPGTDLDFRNCATISVSAIK